jgi:Protein of unknown function (DUF2848)
MLEGHQAMSRKLTLQRDGAPVDFSVRRVLVAGYTGRDASQVRAHIEELERQGIPAPDSVPAFYPIDPCWATVETNLSLAPGRISGEAEPALLFCGNSLEDALVSVIIDFTDRTTERQSVARSKEAPKPLSAQVWNYSDVEEEWDEMALRSWVEPGPGRHAYQTGKLKQLLAPRDLLERLRPRLGGQLAGTVLLMGTLPLQSPEFLFTDYFACELENSKRSKLSCECRLRRPIPMPG